MTPRSYLLSVGTLALVACHASMNPAATGLRQAGQAAATQAMTAPAVTLDQPPRNWHLLDQEKDHIPGISAERAMNELLAGRAPKRTVVVAVLDVGTDTAHVDLKANIWTNPKETAGNGRDDDNNGYVDDIHGWNFIGGRDGRNVSTDTYEMTREYARCHKGAAADGRPPITDAEYCRGIDSAFKSTRAATEDDLWRARIRHEAYQLVLPILKQATGRDSLTEASVRAFSPTTEPAMTARQLYLDLMDDDTPLGVARWLANLEEKLNHGLNPEWSPRSIIGDHYTDVTERGYGNNDVTGPNAFHGTHVAGIIGAVRDDANGVGGIAPAVRIMIVRVVTSHGDERDKDDANGIRYAVDNGAQIINMSFGKRYSPDKAVLDAAVRYADAHNVLMVHAAGNDAADLNGTNGTKYYPSASYAQGGKAQNWIEVGASSWKGGDGLAYRSSNYGQQVDVFAPGVDILSTAPGNTYILSTGTSMAAPVVSGLAALLMEYYPSLSAAEVKHIILASAARYSDQRVLRPGSDGGTVPFGALSVAGGIVNAYNAVKMAEMSKGSPRP